MNWNVYKLSKLNVNKNLVVIFRDILNNSVVSDLLCLVEKKLNSEISSEEFLKYYGDFVAELYKNTVNLSRYILKIILENENIYIKLLSKGKKPDDFVEKCLKNELLFFQEVASLVPDDFFENIDYDGFLPRWKTSDIDFLTEYKMRVDNLNRFGWGLWAKSNMFKLKDGQIKPVEFPDRQRLSDLYGYDMERRVVIGNTLALLNGKPAQNVLLYGDAGTGKSSTVKAIVNQYSDRGLRLIEVTKDELSDISEIVSIISENPLKFIIFIDDLSFTSGEDCFAKLKAVLEGSVSSKSDNMVIYATSNRRHLVRESFSDREGDDVHRNDTLQETLSLSARFGLRVNFSRPDKKNYIAIVKRLAIKAGLNMPSDELELKAEQFAISSGNGRSPRTAKQFVSYMLSGGTV